MLNITIVSPFRDSENIIPKWLRCIDHLDYPKDNLRVVMVEGDSTDNSPSFLLQLAEERENFSYVRFDTGSQKYPSEVSEARFSHLSRVFNKCLESIDWDWTEASLFIPSDVIFPADLVKSLVSANKDLISPYFFAPEGPGLRYYDIWGFVDIEGNNFPPLNYTHYLTHFPLEPFEVKYIGGAMLMSRTLYNLGCRYSEKDVDHGISDKARELGFSPYCDPRVSIIHI